MSKKYFIVPVNDIAMEIYAGSAGSALEVFAWEMDSDMNTYFKAVTEEEYNIIKEEKEWKGHVRIIKNFMRNVIIDDFNVPEEDADDVADLGYEHYTEGDYPSTEYESAEWAAEKYWEDHDEEEEE